MLYCDHGGLSHSVSLLGAVVRWATFPASTYFMPGAPKVPTDTRASSFRHTPVRAPDCSGGGDMVGLATSYRSPATGLPRPTAKHQPFYPPSPLPLTGNRAGEVVGAVSHALETHRGT